MAEPDDIPARVLAVYAHPDDPEISAGGTLARWADAGAEVQVLDHDPRRQGHDDPDADLDALAALRVEETAAAARVLGVAGHHHLDHPDGELADDRALRGAIVRCVRELRPEVVLCPDPDRGVLRRRLLQPPRPPRHRLGDARRGRARGRATRTTSPSIAAEGLEVHQVRAVYLSGTLEPNSWVDIGATLERKIEALFCHASQLVETGDWFREFLRERAEEGGRGRAACRYAEAFRRLTLGTPERRRPVCGFWRCHSAIARSTSTATMPTPAAPIDRADERADEGAPTSESELTSATPKPMMPPRIPATTTAANASRNAVARREHRRRRRLRASRRGRVHRRFRMRRSPADGMAMQELRMTTWPVGSPHDARARGAAHVQRDREHRGRPARDPRARCPTADVLVVDDGSPDGTADRAEKLDVELGGIEVLRRAREVGPRLGVPRRVPRRASRAATT